MKQTVVSLTPFLLQGQLHLGGSDEWGGRELGLLEWRARPRPHVPVRRTGLAGEGVCEPQATLRGVEVVSEVSQGGPGLQIEGFSKKQNSRGPPSLPSFPINLYYLLILIFASRALQAE